ncbi:MAG: class I SAM-dependent methyltransferase [Planctomycetes bacterium]|nr:class I SAM-dependent methyltransferase [Planctomycetota bacterium]
MKRGVLIQAADGPHRGLLEVAHDHHLKYADRHGLDYWCHYGNPTAPKRAGWAKITLLLAALRIGYRQALWIDADAIIVSSEHDILAACSSGLGMVQHPNPTHWNTGVMVANYEPAVVALLARVEAEPENGSAWMEQHALNQLAAQPEYIDAVRELSAAYNSTIGAILSPDPVIMAAHGLPMATRRRLVCEWVAQASGDAQQNAHSSGRVPNRHAFGDYLNSRGLVGDAVEVGVGRGEFSKILLDSWRGRKLHLVDPWRQMNDYQDIANVGEAEQKQRMNESLTRLAPHSGRFEVHRELSLEAATRFDEGSLDFVYIDANHALQSVLEDIHAWYPKVRAGGILAGHDYIDGVLPEGVFGVRSAVSQFEAETGLSAHATNERWPSWYIEKPTRANTRH